MRRISDQSAELKLNKRQSKYIVKWMWKNSMLSVNIWKANTITDKSWNHNIITHPFSPQTDMWDREQTLEMSSCSTFCVKWKDHWSFLHTSETRLHLIGQPEVILHVLLRKHDHMLTAIYNFTDKFFSWLYSHDDRNDF